MSIHPNLPEVCYAFVEDGAGVVTILRGQPGYHVPSNLPQAITGDAKAAMAWVDARNRAMGVSPAQREAMLAGSMFGWHQPLAAPDKFPQAGPYLPG